MAIFSRGGYDDGRFARARMDSVVDDMKRVIDFIAEVGLSRSRHADEDMSFPPSRKPLSTMPPLNGHRVL